MKIFQVITVSEYGGAQSIVANLLEGMSDDNDVFVLYGGNGEAWKDISKKVVRIKISEHRKELSWKDFILLIKLYYYRFKYKPDIVHLHSSKMGALGRIAFNKNKVVYTIHGFDSIRKAFRKFLFVEKLLKNRAASIVGVSKYDVECLHEEGITKNVDLVYNGLSDCSSSFIDKKDLNLIDNRLKEIKVQYKKIVLCISRISKQKKFDLFLEIASQMPEYAFVWIGNKTEIEITPDNVFCLGEAHSAHQYLTYADLFILPSNYEGLPVSILEALCFGVPVVASAVGGITEVLNGKNGFAVENEISIFKEKIKYVLDDDIVYARMVLAARESYLNHFTIDKMINGYKSIYESILTKR